MIPRDRKILDECVTHMDALYRVALRMTGNEPDAEDLVQDTYAKAIRSIHRYHEEGLGVRPWLFRILTNAYIDLYRRRKRSPRLVELSEEGGLYELFLEQRSASGAGTPWIEEELEEFLNDFVGDEVRAAFESLPPSFRLVVVLRDVEGFSYREIAEMTGVPMGTVMSRLFRGRRLLQRRLAEYARAHGYRRGTEAG